MRIHFRSCSNSFLSCFRTLWHNSQFVKCFLEVQATEDVHSPGAGQECSLSCLNQDKVKGSCFMMDHFEFVLEYSLLFHCFVSTFAPEVWMKHAGCLKAARLSPCLKAKSSLRSQHLDWANVAFPNSRKFKIYIYMEININVFPQNNHSALLLWSQDFVTTFFRKCGKHISTHKKNI